MENGIEVRRMRVLLVAPTALDFDGRPIKQKRLYLPGLTLPALAAVTPDKFDLELVWETVQEIPFDEPWDLVGLTGMGSGIARAWQIGDEFRRRGVPVVMGGIAASLADPSWSLAHADSLVIGEAEETWPVVLDDAEQGRLQPIYRAPRPAPIDALPQPRYDLMENAPFGRWRPVQATRGCPFSCAFCSITSYFGQAYRKRPIADVLRDVRAAKRSGSRYIAFIDDNIGVDPDYSTALWEALIPEDIVWMSQCGIHIADRPDLLRLARGSGCQLLSFGIESTSPASLRAARKEWNRPERYGEAIARIRAHGIEVSTEMILGFDEDDDTVFEATHDFIMENRISVPRVHILTPVPGTPYFRDLDAAGRILSRDFTRYSGGKVVFQPRNLTPEGLQAGYWKLYERLFSWRSIAHRVRSNLGRVDPFMRAVILGTNLHYRGHVGRRICPGIV